MVLGFWASFLLPCGEAAAAAAGDGAVGRAAGERTASERQRMDEKEMTL
jgi:hypothetical protein